MCMRIFISLQRQHLNLWAFDFTALSKIVKTISPSSNNWTAAHHWLTSETSASALQVKERLFRSTSTSWVRPGSAGHWKTYAEQGRWGPCSHMLNPASADSVRAWNRWIIQFLTIDFLEIMQLVLLFSLSGAQNVKSSKSQEKPSFDHQLQHSFSVFYSFLIFLTILKPVFF